MESVYQIHGEVEDFHSISQFAKANKNEAYIDMVIKGCKEVRNNDPQCEITGTEPVLAYTHFTWMMNDNAVIPAGMSLKKGDFVDDEVSKIGGVAPRLVKKYEENECDWSKKLKLGFTDRVECKNDKENGWEEQVGLIARFPLKHPTVTTPTQPTPSPEEAKPTISAIELYKAKMTAKPVTDDVALKAVAPVEANVHPVDANHTEIDGKAISDGK